MNLPQITSSIGKSVRKNQHPLDSRLQRPKVQLKEGETPYLIFMTFDLDKNHIIFEDPLPFNDGHIKEFYYFGNNPGSNFQGYVVREAGSVHYLLSTVWSDLYLLLENYQMKDTPLAALILDLQRASFITVGKTKGEGEVNLSRISSSAQLPLQMEKTNDKKTFLVRGKKASGETLLRTLIEDDNKKNKYVLVVPRIRKDGQDVVLSQHPDYLRLVMKINQIDDSGEGQAVTKQGKDSRICYICHRASGDVSIKNSTKFLQSGINKFFTTTTINASRYLPDGINYDDVYSFCNECYLDLLSGEKFVEERMVGRIARERAFMLPESLLGEIDYQSIGKIKDHLDFAFNSEDAEHWIKSVEAEVHFIDQEFYVVHIVIYRTDGKSVTLLDTIEDVPLSRFVLLNRMFQRWTETLRPHLRYFSMGTIYRIIPVREVENKEKKKIQVDVGRVLSLYKAILSGHLVERETIFAYAADALDKGMRELSKEKIDNFKNMDLYKYVNKEDFFIKKIVMSYLVLMQCLQELKILNFPFFHKEGERLHTVENQPKNNSEATVQEMEKFLVQQGFTDEAKALFFLGTLLHRVAMAQYSKEHKMKPILKKIQFQGMNIQEILRLYNEVVEKLMQYNKMTLFSEMLMNRFHHYQKTIWDKWPLSDHANVFYLLSGYAYMVGTKAPDMTPEEINAIQDEIDVQEELQH